MNFPTQTIRNLTVDERIRYGVIDAIDLERIVEIAREEGREEGYTQGQDDMIGDPILCDNCSEDTGKRK